VGSIYLTVSATSPASLFGGTWTKLTNRFLLGAGGSYGVNATGGEATHKLSAAEMPSHAHTVTIAQTYVSSSDGETYQWHGYLNHQYSNDGTVSYTTANTGSSGAHNNMPPYLAVYMWKRTA